MTRVCLSCGETKDIAEYRDYKDKKAGKTYKSHRCRSCIKIYNSERRRDPRVKKLNRNVALQYNFKMSLEDYESILLEQDGCGICHRQPKEDEYFAVDHNHSCCTGPRTCGKCVRGVLCRSCNIALGTFGDNEEGLLRALEFVRGRNATHNT